jgi:hypothetical protein
MVGDMVHQLLQKKETQGLTVEDFQDCDLLVKKEYPDLDDDAQQAVAVEAARLVAGHVEAYREDPTRVIGTETHLEVELEDCTFYSRVDAIARTQDGRLWRLEYKTTSKMDSAFLSGLKGDLQTGTSHFVLKEVLKEKIHGTIFDLLVKTKVPQYYRSPVPYSQRVVDRAMETVQGVARSIKRGDLYPSSKCFPYNRECEFRTLCDAPESQRDHLIKTFYEAKKV